MWEIPSHRHSLEIPPTLPFWNPGKNAEHTKWALQTFAGKLLSYCHWANLSGIGNNKVNFLCYAFFSSFLTQSPCHLLPLSVDIRQGPPHLNQTPGSLFSIGQRTQWNGKNRQTASNYASKEHAKLCKVRDMWTLSQGRQGCTQCTISREGKPGN